MSINEIIENIKKWWKKTSEQSEKYAEKFNKSKIGKLLNKVTRWSRKLLYSIIVWWVLGAIFPSLREKIPSLYRLVDTTLIGVEYLFQFFWYIVESIICFFC